MKKAIRYRKRVGLDEKLKTELQNAPQIKGYTVKELSVLTKTPWVTTRWHLELMEKRGEVSHKDIGRSRVYFLKEKKQ